MLGATIAWVLAVGCGPSAPAGGGAWLGDTHHVKPPRGSAAEARSADRPGSPAALARALREGRPGDAVVIATHLRARGMVLPAARAAEVAGAVDAISVHRLDAVWDELDRGYAPAARVAVRRAMWALHRGEVARVGAILAEARTAGGAEGDPLVSARIADIERALAMHSAADPDTIAVLLPLSGRFEPLGRALRRAIEVAATPDASARLVFIDTGGDEARAAWAVEQAVGVHRAIAILGPVGAETSRRAAAEAARMGVPIALLAPAEGIGGGAQPRAGVFRLWTSAAWEAQQAARFAFGLGHTRLAVLAPRDEHGRRAARAFEVQAVALGAEIVRRGSYDPTGTELEADMKVFLQLEPVRNPRLRRFLRQHGSKEGWKRFSPDVPFDLLYIPGRHPVSALVASFLPYFNVEVRTREFMDARSLRRKHGGRIPQVVQLLGSSGWNHPGLGPSGGPAVEGALIVDVCTAGPDIDYASDDAARFAEVFEARTGQVPGRLSALAHDAAALVLAAHGTLRADASRDDMRRALSIARITAGACGPARIEAGLVTRDALLLRVEQGALVPHEF